MSRTQSTQRQRTQDNPLNLGTFNQTSLRYLRGSLGPQNKLIGYRDTTQTSNGGFGGGAYNHWFKVNLLNSAWLILIKGNPRPNYIQVSTYELDNTPIEGRGIFQADSVSEIVDGQAYYPYVGHSMGAQSDLYNFFSRARLDQGDDRYYPLGPGSYLICISTTRNEPLDYELGLIVEFESTDYKLQTEQGAQNFIIYENDIDSRNTVVLGPTITSNYTIPTGYNAYTNGTAIIQTGITVTIPSGSTWFIDNSTINTDENPIWLDLTENYTGQDEHLHSLSEWQTAWERDHQADDKFPEIFLPLITTS